MQITSLEPFVLQAYKFYKTFHIYKKISNHYILLTLAILLMLILIKLKAKYITGHGESILKICLAHNIILRMHLCPKAISPDEAAKISINSMQSRLDNTAGAIVLSPIGQRGVYHNTKRMGWASCKLDDSFLEYGIEQGQCETEQL